MSLIARITQHVVELTRLAVPMMVARAGMLIMALVDMTMVGHYSTPELAFQSIGQAPVATLFVTGLGLMMGTSVMAARFYGAGQLHECGMVWRRAVPYALIMGGVMLAMRSPPLSEPANNQFFLPSPSGRIARSAMLLSISTRPSSM